VSAAAAIDDTRFMELALRLGRRGFGRTWPNPAVGAVIVKDGVIVGRGWTQPGGRPHAEVEALRRAGAAARGATLYVTLEPCSHFGKTPPCADAIIAAGITRVVSAIEDTNPKVAGAGHGRLRAAGITVDIGIGAEAARRHHAGHIRRMTEGRPHVTLKLAISANGKAGGAGRRPLAITAEPARQRVHLLRGQSDAIMIGIGTVLADDPMLSCRLPGMCQNSPLRIVLDTALRLPATSRLVQTARQIPVWVVTGHGAPTAAANALRTHAVEVFRSAETGGKLDLAAVLKMLGARGVTRLLLEGGPTLASAMLVADLVDDAILFHSPIIVGNDGIDALDAAGAAALARHLTLVDSEAVGPDRRDNFDRRH
jgi:diaminohydroxyphosphoribosylaminopyrimidine deaminase/5-amino-6-(5-phosphoribosylamino)uracil reductase